MWLTKPKVLITWPFTEKILPTPGLVCLPVQALTVNILLSPRDGKEA